MTNTDATRISRADTHTADRGWVARFLAPRLIARFPNAPAISCLQISPDDSSEAEMLRNLGYRCEMTDPTPTMELCFPDSSWDFAFSGHFPSQARDRTARVLLAKEMFRVLRGGGSLLLAIGNRLCPFDLTRNGGMFHGAGADYCVSLKEMRGILIGEAGFANVGLLNVNGHFGWGSLPSIIRPLGRILDAHWRYLAIPSREWIYASPLNPTLLLWISKT